MIVYCCIDCLQGDLDEEIPESCSSSDDDLELDETNLGEGLLTATNLMTSFESILIGISIEFYFRRRI